MLHSFALVAAIGSFASSALAKDSGFEFGGRLGYGVPWGRFADPDADDDDDSADVSEWVSGQIPLQLDAGYRIDPQLFVGGYFSYGIGFVGDICDGGDDIPGAEIDCSVSTVRLGAQLTYHFTPVTEGNAGWIGGGMGFEWLTLEQEYDYNIQGESFSGTGSLQVSGFEFLNLQGGYDFAVSEAFRVGPYAMLTVAQYSDVEIEAGGQSESEEIDDKAMHGWLVFGVKGTFGPF